MESGGPEGVDASSISAFEGWLNKIRETRMGFFID